MIELTRNNSFPDMSRNNHFQFGYNNQLWNHGDQQKDIITYKYGPISRKPSDVMSEGLFMANEISKKAGNDLVLLLSGGIDSEIMVRFFMSIGAKFSCEICRFNDNLNWYDIKYGIEFCNKYNITYHIHDLDIIDFYQSGEYEEYAIETKCPSPQIVTYIWLVNRLKNFFPMLGGQPSTMYNSYKGLDRFINFQLKNKYDVVFLKDIISDTKGNIKDAIPPLIQLMSPSEFPLYRFFIQRKIQGVPHFYHYSPEFTYAWLTSTPVLNYINQKAEFENDLYWDYSVKRKLYDLNFNFKDVAHRPLGGGGTATSGAGGGGFELVKEYFKNKGINYEKQFRWSLLKKFPNAMDRVVVQNDNFIKLLEDGHKTFRKW